MIVRLCVALKTILRTCSECERYTPRTKRDVERARKLWRCGLIEEDDNHPGSFQITRNGQRVFDQMERLDAAENIKIEPGLPGSIDDTDENLRNYR